MRFIFFFFLFSFFSCTAFAQDDVSMQEFDVVISLEDLMFSNLESDYVTADMFHYILRQTDLSVRDRLYAFLRDSSSGFVSRRSLMRLIQNQDASWQSFDGWLRGSVLLPV